jgi:hypothetical protein
MLKIIGWTALILLVGTLAIAWSVPPLHQTSSAPMQAIGISPHEMQVKLGVAGLPLTKIDDRSLVFVDP